MADLSELPQWPEQPAPSIAAYSALFGLTYFAGAFALGMLLRLAPRNNSSGLGHFMVFGAAILTGWIFVRRHKRAFTKSESRRLIAFCSVWVLAVEFLAIIGNPQIFRALPPPALAGVIVFAVAVDVLIVWASFRHVVRKFIPRRLAAQKAADPTVE